MTKTVTFKEGEIIYRFGEKANGAYIIKRGKVSINTPKQVKLATLGEGELFGELGQIVDSQRSATVRATTDCALTFIPDRILQEKFKKCDPAIIGMFRAMAIRLKKANEHNDHIQEENNQLKVKIKNLEP
tara:strand:+ start:466 stop:855 length:390 start_codon:yes stop_codon:yes gene_type:complete